MRVRRFARCIALLLLSALLVSGLPGVEAQGGRTPMTLSLGMSTEATAFENLADFQAPAVWQLIEGGQGTQTVTCQTPTGCTTLYAWVSEPLFNNSAGAPATFVSGGPLDFTIGAGAQAPQGTAQGAVTFTIEYGYFAPGANLHVHDLGDTFDAVEAGEPTGQVPVPLPAGPINGQTASINLSLEGSPSVPAGGRIAIALSVVTDGVADFTFTHNAFPSLGYVWGDPTEADTDGDGFPDSVDDDADGDGSSNEDELAVGSDPFDAASNPDMDADGDGHTLAQEAAKGRSDDDPNDWEGGFPWLLIILIVLVVLLLAGGAVGAVAVVGRKVKISVSHDGFQAIDKGQVAEYEVTVLATGKKEEMIPVQLSLKGVPEDWSAQLEPDHLTLYTGEGAEAQLATLRLVPPPDEDHESEAQVTITATPTDEEGKTSAMKPGSSVKTKTIVNIGVTPPEGEKKARKRRSDIPAEEPGAVTEGAEEEKPKRKFGLGRRKKEAGPEGAEATEGATASEAASAATPAAAAAAGGKPSIAMGQMAHDPADFSAGDPVTTKVSVRNKGDGPVTNLKLSLYVNDARADQQTVDLAAGESKEVSFSWTAQPDENRVRIKGGLAGA